MQRGPSWLIACLACIGLLGAAPHVQTSDYFGGYAGTHFVDPRVAARWLTWAETNIADSQRMRPLGVKTLMYTDPNRAMQGDHEFTNDETTFAHDCGGNRIVTNRAGQYLMDPHSPRLLAAWKNHVDRYAAEGHFDAIFNDDADDVAYVHGVPCNFNSDDWLRANNALQRSLGYPVVYNGLSNFTGDRISPAIGLNATAIGGMMEQCYAPSPSQPKSGGTAWLVTEATELQMAAEGKYFFCYGNDTSAAAASLDARLYVDASFLLTYDPATSVLWEYYQGPSRFHVMPESELVPTAPRRRIGSIGELRTAGGAYVREYGACYLDGTDRGPCAIAVNPNDGGAARLDAGGYRRALAISGGGVLDGGSVRIVRAEPPRELAPLSAAVLFR